MANLITVSGLRMILNVQYSKIGSPYPRLFVETPKYEYVNIDLTLGASFKMPEKDWLDWIEDAIVVEDAKALLEEHSINYDVLVKVAEEIKSW